MCVCVCCAYLLRGGGDYSLLQPVRLLLEVFTRLVVPQQVLLHLRRQNTTRASSAHKTNDTQEHNEEQSLRSKFHPSSKEARHVLQDSLLMEKTR